MYIFDFINELPSDLSDILELVAMVVVLFNIISGLMYCFFGYKLYRLVILIQGFLVGAVIGAVIGLFSQSEMGILLCVFCIGALGAFLSWYLFYIGVFLQAFGTGMLITIVALVGTGNFDSSIVSASIMAGIFMGVLACILIKVAIVFLTAFSGAMTLSSTLGLMMELESSETIVLCVVLFTMGFFFQMWMTRKQKKEGNEADSQAQNQSQETIGNKNPISEQTLKVSENNKTNSSTPVIAGITMIVLVSVFNILSGLGNPFYYFYYEIFYHQWGFFVQDILYFLGIYGFGYFGAKQLGKRTDIKPLDFSLSNKAFCFGLGGAFAGLILMIFLKTNLFRWQPFAVCFGGFTLMYLITNSNNKNSRNRVDEMLPPQKAPSNIPPVNREHFFAADIDNELDYVFSNEILSRMKTMPEIHEDGTWTCSCGTRCDDSFCMECGMAKEDVKNKFTYQYLKRHREERLAKNLK